MKPILPLLPALALLALGGPTLAQDEPEAADPAAEQTEAAPDQAALIAQAESAGPAAVAAGATIHGFDETGQMVTLREGTNGWWCMPDDPVSPAVDPMCGDANSMEWVMAWIGKTEPPAGKPGFIYMLQEGSDSSGLPQSGGPGSVLVHDRFGCYGWCGRRSGSGWRSRPLDDLWSWGPIAQR
jgi:hypothetical protein